MKPIPDNIKEILSQLGGPQQVALRGYIGTLRAEMKDLEAQLHALQNPVPDHGHYHGHELCTADHGHSEHAHDEHKKEHDHGHKEHGHKHKEHDHKEHGHKHNEHCDHKEHDHNEHGHKHNEHCDHKEHHEHGHKEHHDHGHKDHDHEKHHHEHKEHHDHGHKEHEHKKHHHHEPEEMPAWKKKAMESDPTVAPFGGSWNTESNINAKHDDKMQE